MVSTAWLVLEAGLLGNLPASQLYKVTTTSMRLSLQTCTSDTLQPLPSCMHRTGQLGTALSAGCAALSALGSAFGVPYALPKLDLVSNMMMCVEI